MKDMFNLEKKVVVVTGASSGLGKSKRRNRKTR